MTRIGWRLDRLESVLEVDVCSERPCLKCFLAKLGEVVDETQQYCDRKPERSLTALLLGLDRSLAEGDRDGQD